MMKRFYKIALATLLVLLVSGCFKKDFPVDAIVLRGSKTLNFEVGSVKTVKVELFQNDSAMALTVNSDSDALTATLSDNSTLTLTSQTAGEYVVTLILTAKGYKPLEVRYPVSVTLKEMDVKIIASEGNAVDSAKPLIMSRDDIQQLKLSGLPDGATISLHCAEPEVLSAELSGDSIALSALSPGQATLLLTAEHRDYTPFVTTLNVKIEKTAALLNLSQQSVSGTTLQTLQVGISAYQTGGQLSLETDDPAVSAILNGETISITSTKPGNFTVTVSCLAADYHPTAKTIQAVFSLPPLPLTAPSSVAVTVGNSADITVTGYPVGTTLSVSASNGNVTATQSGGKITITGHSAGNATLTVAARCAGYADSKVTISVKVNNIALSASNQYSAYAKQVFDLTNQERISRGLSKLTYLVDLEGAAQARAKEASVLWSHTRPDGRGWETILKDIGYNYVTAGENLFASNKLDAQLAVDSWMDSEGHRRNILREEFEGLSVGVVKGNDDEYYYAQIFIMRN